MIFIKETTKFTRIKPHMLYLLLTIEETYRTHGVDCWLTSANDSTHKEGSKHYSDDAYDFRSKNVPDKILAPIIAELKNALGPDYRVLYEGAGTQNAHLHCGYYKEA